AAELSFPPGRITVNLAPAELRKEGSGFDLPIALALLAASQQLPRSALERTAAVGELALDGRLRRVGGVLAVAEGARRLGVERLLCPADSAREAALAGVAAMPIRHLAEAVAYLRGELELEPEPPIETNGHGASAALDLADVRGQERARRALELAAAGGRSLFPARFQLIATMNLCPCGGRGDPAAQCSCSAQRLARYRDKLSRALLDRFDLVLAMPRVRAEELAAAPSESSEAVGKR